MLPRQPYHPGGYPPGPGWAQFGEPILQQALSTTDEARSRLAQKRQGMQKYHEERLQQDGFMAPPEWSRAPPTAQEQGVAAYDHPDVARPSHLPPQHEPEFHDMTIEDGEESVATISEPGTPREGLASRATRAGFQMAGEMAGNAGHSMKEALQGNVASTIEYAQTGGRVVSEVARVVKNASKRAASVGVEGAMEAVKPGSNTRKK